MALGVTQLMAAQYLLLAVARRVFLGFPVETRHQIVTRSNNFTFFEVGLPFQREG
jgi:hypothetical protein